MAGRSRRGAGNDPPPPPPPALNIEQPMTMQTQILPQMAQNMQNNQNNPPPPPPLQPCDKRGEFLKGRPPVFSSSPDPLEADD